jgi:hypothetical protein
MRYRNLVQPLEILIIHTNNQLQFDYIKTDSSKKKTDSSTFRCKYRD